MDSKNTREAAPKTYIARFFFSTPGREAAFCENADLIGESTFDAHPSDDELRDAAKFHVCSNESRHKQGGGSPEGGPLAKTQTHTIVADVGITKETGGLGASYPKDTVILFRPP